jgi:YesN/AraC family two-component response regulator
MGVNDYINTVRIAKAVCLLKQTEMTIGDIATDTGFKNQRYFSTFFRQIKGVSPTEFRKTE